MIHGLTDNFYCLVTCHNICHTCCNIQRKKVTVLSTKEESQEGSTKEGLVAKIERLKQERDAVILAHFYVDDDVQDVADYTGDSYNLSKLAAGLDHKMIVFAGVQFMGESAKLLSPEKTVVLPNPQADCPMAHMVSKDAVDRAREEYDDLAVACYVNSTAEIKSWSDVCVTSSNALEICKRLPQKNILFIPDQNLGRYIASLVPEKHFIFNEGFCPIHQDISPDEVHALKEAYPHAPVLAHPECNELVCKMADYLGSTAGIIDRVVSGEESDYIICTVVGVAHEIEKRLESHQAAGKQLHFPATTPRCEDMSSITLESVVEALEGGIEEVEVDEAFAPAARGTLTRMLELSR